MSEKISLDSSVLNYYQNVTFKPPEIVRIGVYLSVEAVV